MSTPTATPLGAISLFPIDATVPAETGMWIGVLRRYVAFMAIANLLWEILQLPLYTIWWRPLSEIAYAVLHCTAGDVLIATTSIVGALLLFGDGRWPFHRFGAVAAIVLLAGIAVTVFSEWLNTEVRGSWTYAQTMPRLPPLGTGLSPLAQWVVVPLAAFWWAHRPVAEQMQRRDRA
jgi:hypothetical protein